MNKTLLRIIAISACLGAAVPAQQPRPAEPASLAEPIAPAAEAPDVKNLPPVGPSRPAALKKRRPSHGIPAYTLGPGDKIVVRALDVEEFPNEPVLVDDRGTIDLPYIGRINVQGLTLDQVEAEVTRRLRKYVRRPDVTVSIAEFRPRPVSVYGAVERPGVVQLRGPKTLWELISDVGGFSNQAGDKIRITRRLDEGDLPLPNAQVDETGRYITAEISTRDVLEMTNPDTNIELMAHDVISVSIADVVYVVGHVHRAGGFVTNGSISVLEALSLAGGFQPHAAAKNARILRVKPGTDERLVIPVNLKKVLRGESEDMALKPQDILFIPHDSWKDFGTKMVIAATAAAATSVIWASIRYR